MSLATIQGKLSRAEMKNIMTGSGSGSGDNCPLNCDSNCNEEHNCQCRNAGTSNQFCASVA